MVNQSRILVTKSSANVFPISTKMYPFFGSVRDNITLFRGYSPDVFNGAVDGAQVNLDLAHIVNDEGRNISSGEQRRIEIARSLLSSVRMIVFDEVVSTLDIETAYEIEKMALDFKDKMVVFISHNFSGKLIRDYRDTPQLLHQSPMQIASGSAQKLHSFLVRPFSKNSIQNVVY